MAEAPRGRSGAPGPRALLWDRPTTPGLRLVAAACAAAGLLALLVLVTEIVRERAEVAVLRERGLVAEGTVTGSVGGRGIHLPVVGFTTAAGEAVVVEGLRGAGTAWEVRDEPLAVRYDPEDPSVARGPVAVPDGEGRVAVVTAAVAAPLTALQVLRAVRPPRRPARPAAGTGVRPPGAAPPAAGAPR